LFEVPIQWLGRPKGNKGFFTLLIDMKFAGAQEFGGSAQLHDPRVLKRRTVLGDLLESFGPVQSKGAGIDPGTGRFLALKIAFKTVGAGKLQGTHLFLSGLDLTSADIDYARKFSILTRGVYGRTRKQ
jgi:hypothetical protein